MNDGSTRILWTIEELGERVAGALEAAGYEGVASGRVRDVPDPRTIRYYTTLGLLDRPAGFRGRTALYGPRHLLQLVAIKRFQALGLTLAEVQQRVAGATDGALARAAGITPSVPRETAPESPPREHPEPPQRRAPETLAPGRREAPRADGRRATAFWRELPPAPEVLPASPTYDRPAGSANPMEAVRLGPGGELTLLLATRRPLDDNDLRVIRLAAAPLIELMRLRGLIDARGHKDEREYDDRQDQDGQVPPPRPEEDVR
jgi:DNA-binding transcriptional MerR regulator